MSDEFVELRFGVPSMRHHPDALLAARHDGVGDGSRGIAQAAEKVRERYRRARNNWEDGRDDVGRKALRHRARRKSEQVGRCRRKNSRKFALKGSRDVVQRRYELHE